MIQINPIEVLLWNIRRSEKDVIKVYDKLAPLMQLGAESNILNFGLWDKNTKDPAEAQKKMCEYIYDFGKFESSKKLLDIGSGYGIPALLWKNRLPELEITCLNLNFNQLNQETTKRNLSFVNSTSTAIPINSCSFDTLVALESAQHFKPLGKFFIESKRVIKNHGNLIMAIPVTENQKLVSLKLGILNLTWTSQHYSKQFIESEAKKVGFEIKIIEEIGSNVFEPLADYYIENRTNLKERISSTYSNRIENLIYNSMEKMKKLSQQKIIDYLLLRLQTE